MPGLAVATRLLPANPLRAQTDRSILGTTSAYYQTSDVSNRITNATVDGTMPLAWQAVWQFYLPEAWSIPISRYYFEIFKTGISITERKLSNYWAINHLAISECPLDLIINFGKNSLVICLADRRAKQIIVLSVNLWQ